MNVNHINICLFHYMNNDRTSTSLHDSFSTEYKNMRIERHSRNVILKRILNYLQDRSIVIYDEIGHEDDYYYW